MRDAVTNSGRPTSFLDTATSGVLCFLLGKSALRASDSLLRFLPKLAPSPEAISTSLPFCNWPLQLCNHRQLQLKLANMHTNLQTLSL